MMTALRRFCFGDRCCICCSTDQAGYGLPSSGVSAEMYFEEEKNGAPVYAVMETITPDS